MEPTRRRFIAMSVWLVAGSRARISVALQGPSGDEKTAVVELSGHFDDLAGVVRVGTAAAATLPDGKNVDALLALIDLERPASTIEQEVRAQYRGGMTVDVGANVVPWPVTSEPTQKPPGPAGPWTLALTEARIFALIALAAEQGILSI